MDTKTQNPQDLLKNKKSQNPENSDVKEIGGFENRPEPTRFGDWDVNGRCSDF